MLFQKDIEPRGPNCRRGARLGDDKFLCVGRGVASPGGSCRRFKYDPLKRVPPPPVLPDFSKLKDEDFSL